MLEFSVWKKFSEKPEPAIYRLCLGVAYSKKYLRRIAAVDSPYCPACQVPDPIQHALCRYVSYGDARASPETTIRVRSRDLTRADLLGQSSQAANKSTAAAVRSLRGTDLSTHL